MLFGAAAANPVIPALVLSTSSAAATSSSVTIAASVGYGRCTKQRSCSRPYRMRNHRNSIQQHGCRDFSSSSWLHSSNSSSNENSGVEKFTFSAGGASSTNSPVHLNNPLASSSSAHDSNSAKSTLTKSSRIVSGAGTGSENTRQLLENVRNTLQDACVKMMPVSLAGVGAASEPTPSPITSQHSTTIGSNTTSLSDTLNNNNNNNTINNLNNKILQNTASGNSSVSSATYRAPTPPTGIPLSRIFSNTFPLPLSEAYEQWTNRHKIQEAEEGVLSHLPFFPEPDATRSAKSLQVDIGNGQWINEFEITQHSNNPPKHELVMLHGYGAGLAFYYRNFNEISKVPGWRIHALDLLGYGRSSRPKFRIDAKDPYDKIKETENFFTDALEAWRKARGLDTFTVVAHSMGGYLSSAYATKYPGRINKLLLVSPAGVPRSPYSISAAERRARGEIDTVPKTSVEIPAWFNFLWEQHVSPFSLIRNTGPLGPRFVSGWTARRFAKLPSNEARSLHRYVYMIFNAPGSGEYALNYLLAPGAHARWPLAERAKDIPCETEWMYGENDWMDVSGGIEAVTNIRQARGTPAPPLHIVRDAGHHIYLDNPQSFNELVIKTMKDVERKFPKSEN